jgi:hypothetical protein
LRVFKYGLSKEASSPEDIIAMECDEDEREERENKGKGVMKCEMVLCIDSGPAYELKWCPLPSHDTVSFLLSFSLLDCVDGYIRS